MVIRNVAQVAGGLQPLVAHFFAKGGILLRMESFRASWKGWRQRAKDWKKDNGLDDAEIAASVGVARATLNSWLNKREPNLSDFMHLCEAMGADPGHILFGRPVLRELTTGAVRQVVSASPTAEPGYREFEGKLKEKSKDFKRKRSKFRRVLVKV
jgi:transcriptional regulator with XRE-family HTH domain